MLIKRNLTNYFLIFILLAQTLIFPAAAQTVNLIDTGYAGEENTELLIYAGDGQYLGVLNTSQPLELFQNSTSQDINIFIRQKQVNPITQPQAIIDWVKNGGWLGLLIAFMIFGMVGRLLFSWGYKKAKKYG